MFWCLFWKCCASDSLLCRSTLRIVSKFIFYPKYLTNPQTFCMWWKIRLAAAAAFTQPFQNSSILSCVCLRVSRKWGTFLGASVVTPCVYLQQCNSFDVFISSKQDVPTYLQHGGTQLPAFCHICA